MADFWGILFDTVAPILGILLTFGLVEVGWASHSIELMLLGALIGLFSTIAEQFLSPATLKVISSGRMERREFAIDKPIVTIGCDERRDVSLYYDGEIAMKHAFLRWEEDGYVIVPESNAKVFVNNMPIASKKLESGDVITVGKTRLLFRGRKATSIGEVSPKKVCSVCGTLNRENAKYCRSCGGALKRHS
ncbi:MAG: FHA domain-containing protein [Armatimonadota bacterium]|nr:FHA domain-containing protein [Armatimonadota bacterium]MDW8025649.1 FHA domain-containing protein [Armatimonadota bacterium]